MTVIQLGHFLVVCWSHSLVCIEELGFDSKQANKVIDIISEYDSKDIKEFVSYFQFGRSIRYPREGILEFEKQQTKQKKGGARSKVNYILRKPDVPPASPQQWRI